GRWWKDQRCDRIGCKAACVAHVTVAKDRGFSAGYHFYDPHVEEFFERRRVTPEFWSGLPETLTDSAHFDVSVAAHALETQNGVIYLHERGGHREFPFLTGYYEWFEIDRLLKSVTYPRPLVHDMAVSIVRSLDANLECVSIDRIDQENYVYFASLHLRSGRKSFTIDVRPSDAIIMALHSGREIFVSNAVLEAF
ncbi:MAG: bifunctional nuclease family protein, partial [Planctomycetota bacterium]|nr:bifunctional nuclease family protein [Planctomycetota bacterium]